MKLVKLKLLFLSHLFFPTSYKYELFTSVHNHLPPTTFSGMLFRFVAYRLLGVNGVKGDWKYHGVTEGLVVRVRRNGERVAIEWDVVGDVAGGKTRPKEGFYPPYLEFHFNAVSLGAYPPEVLKGREPSLGSIRKLWNVIKYIDTRELRLGHNIGIKTWHFTVMDGTDIRVGRSSKRVTVYDVVDAEFKIPITEFYGFILSADEVIDRVFEEALRDGGWYLAKTRGKTLVAFRVEEILEQVNNYGLMPMENLDILPSPEQISRPTYIFTSAILDPEVLHGRKIDRAVKKTYLFATSMITGNNKFLAFISPSRKTLTFIPSSWLKWMRVPR